MKVLVSSVALLLALATSVCLAVEASGERQGRSVASGAPGNSLGSSNSIEHSSSKSRIELERRQVQEFLTTKNIFKSIVKLLFGNQDEITATSRNVLSVLGKVLDLLKSTFGQKARSSNGDSPVSGIKVRAEDAASAGISVLQGYVRSVLAQDDRCVQRYLCQASRDALRDSKELGYIIASVGGYASSYLLDNTKEANFKRLYEASLKGRQPGEDCAKIYHECPE